MIHNKPLSDSALLTRREKDWILGNITVSIAIQRDIRYRIRRKLETLFSEELPLLMDKGFLVDKANALHELVFNPYTCSVATNGDGVVPNGDGSNCGGRWSSLVKIPPLTMPNVKNNAQVPSGTQTRTITQNTKWAGSDLNQRPPPCQGGILTKLDHRPVISII
jgi:hypothetical protein